MTATKTKKAKSYKTDAELDAEIERLEREELRLTEIEDHYETTHLWEFYNPFGWQDNISSVLRKKMIVFTPAPNGIGKTTEMVCVLSSWAEGYEAWNEVDADYTGAVKADGKYFKPSSLGIKPPVRLRLTGEDWNHHLGRFINIIKSLINI